MAPSLHSSSSAWLSPPPGLRLEESEVHVWRAGLDTPPERTEALRAVLDVEERARADRFLREVHGRRFTVARATLRVLLGRYLDTRPGDLRFRYTEEGKPSLDGADSNSGIEFNVSHSQGLGLFGFVRRRAIGVDVEGFRERVESLKIAKRFFSPGEVETLFNLPEETQEQGFYNCWTRKEAYIKARGLGLHLPLDSFDVTLAPGEPAALLRAGGGEEELARWSFVALEPGGEYAAAVAVEGQGLELRCWQFEDGPMPRP